ncbi:MAG: ATP-dependent Lon protease, partial [Planctomycetota bacterium]
EGSHHAICQGQERFQVVEMLSWEPFPRARVRIIPAAKGKGRSIEARFRVLRQRAGEVLALAPGAPEELTQAVQAINDPSVLADMVSTFMDVPAADKQALLEEFDLRRRLDKLNEILGELSQVMELSNKIRHETRGKLDEAQREYFLREQLRAIRRELGEEDGDDVNSEVSELRRRIGELELIPEVRKAADRELRRLSRTPEGSAEHPMLRTWLETFVDLPWNNESEDLLDLKRAEQVLDEDHYGLERVKRRVLEFLAVRKLKADGQGPTLCLVGPPGVGKTSLGESLARAMGREFVRLSLGGVHDESEVRGHRRTYVGAMPGGIINGMRKAGTRNPVFLLDEVDKLGSGMHGDPSAALLEALDPAQNKGFRDSYLDLPFDLSRVMFVATANMLHSMPGPLRDRLEVIEIPGYTAKEKLEIAKRYLVKRQIKGCGLKASQLRLPVSTLRALIESYSREAGVRELERTIGALCRHAATLFAKRRRKLLIIEPKDLERILGPARYEHEERMKNPAAGLITGLAWTPVGGEILFIEGARMPGKGKLTLTGQLGDVMRESAQAALTWVRSNDEALGLDQEPFDKQDLHLHIPAGAVPKDGPSAGVAMACCLVSLLTGRKPRGRLAMTGEISLRGEVLPVGGIKEKVLAAQAAGVRTVLLPARNRRDLLEIPKGTREKLTFIWIERVEDALEAGLL